ncbi:MAG: polyprenyl synthetase family protein [Bacteroidota bacterium]|nr:polyprenyl synthetase family protein [Bacteroidota bacterium]
MQTLSQLSVIIEAELGKLVFPERPENLYQPIEYVMGMGGKRLRPILLLMGHQLFADNIEKAISPAIGIEIFHNFTLLHDDIMDQAPIRRGRQTVHEKWDNNVAILSGDTMLVQTYDYLADVDESIIKELLTIFNKTAIQVCEGQQMDMDFETQKKVSLQEYLKMIEYKTAVLLAASLQIGGITANAVKKDQKNLYQFGINLGIAFQLKDDLLDAFGDMTEFGKKIGGDIRSNKKTFLYLKAIQLADDKQKEDLENHFITEDQSEQKVIDVKSIFTDLDIQNHTIDMMKAYYTKAMRHLDAIDSNKKEPLLDFSNKLMNRIS